MNLQQLWIAAVAVFLTGSISLAASVARIDQNGLSFSARSLSLRAGDTVAFTNSDEVIHNVHIMTMEGEIDKNLGLQKPGAPLSHVFGSKGNFVIRCNIHPSMKIDVKVN